MGNGAKGHRWRAIGEPEYASSSARWAAIYSGTVYCVCEEGRRQLQEARDRDYKIRCDWTATQRQGIWFRDSGIPTRFSEFQFRTHPLTAVQPDLIRRMHWKPEDKRNDENDGAEGFESWLFWGGYGCGKTGLAVSMAHFHVFGNGEPDYPPATVLFRSIPDLMTELRSTYGRHEGPSEADMLQRYRDVDLLILDDLGAEQLSGTGWLEDRLYQIIGHRHGDQKQTIFTSNLSPAELGARIGERNMWRVMEMCTDKRVVNIKGPNLRAVKK